MSNHPAPEPLTALIAWLTERRENAKRLANGDRGWLEDADYFDRAVRALASQEAHPARPSDVHSTESESTAVQRPVDLPAPFGHCIGVRWHRVETTPSLQNEGVVYIDTPAFTADQVREHAARVVAETQRSSHGSEPDEKKGVEAHPAPAGSDRLKRLKDAIEGECEGLGITDEHARAILEYVDGAPAGSEEC